MADFLSGGAQNKPLIAGGLDIQTSTNIIPIPIGWGQNTLSGNLIFTDDFQFHNNSGGKGFGGKGGQASFYSANIAVAFCRGIISGIPLTYEGSQIHYDDIHSSYYASIGATIFTGTYPSQADWMAVLPNSSYASSNYASIAGFAAPNFKLGGSPSAPNFNYVIQFDPRFFAPYSKVFIGEVNKPTKSFAATGGDPGLIINDLINGDIDAGRGFPGLTLDQTTCLTENAVDPSNDNTFQTWCWANSVYFSPVLRNAEKAGGILDRWASFMFFELGFWDGSLKILPRGDATQTGNGLTFTPNTTPIFALTVDDFVTSDTEMPIKISRKAPEDIPNVVRLEVINDVNEWSPLPVEVRNEPDFLGIGSRLRVLPTIQAHEITNAKNVAPLLANLILRRQQNLRNTFEFNLGPGLGSLLTPMDLVSLTDVASGLNGYVVRLQSVASDEKGLVKVTAEDYLLGSSSAAIFEGPTGLGASTNTNLPADPVNPPIIFEPPSTLASPAMLYFILSGGFGNEFDLNWGGCFIFGSVGGGAYSQIGQTDAGQCGQGLLTANIAAYAGANPDMANTLSVELNESGRTLVTFPTASAAAGSSVCYVDGELIGYTTATLASINVVSSELQQVPDSPGPYTISVNFASNWISDGGVSYTGGATLTAVSGAPAMGQYHAAAGVYTFNSGDHLAAVTVTYTRSAPGYNLTGLYRGMYGTAPGAHLLGTKFGFIDADTAVTKVALPPSYIGQTVNFKFPSFNIFGSGAQDISTCVVYPYTILGAGFGGGPGVPTVPTGLMTSVGGGALPTVALTASEALTGPAIVNIWNNSGTANVQNANATDATEPAWGFVLASVAMSATAIVSLPGALITGLSGLAAGLTYYLSTSDGLVTATAPSATGNLVQQIGVAQSSTTILFTPSQGVLL